MSGVYWGLTAMHLLGKQHMMDTEGIVKWVLSCQRPNGGFGGSERHDPHLLYTQAAILILALCDALDRIDRELVMQCAHSASKALVGYPVCSELLPLQLVDSFKIPSKQEGRQGGCVQM